MAGLFFCIYGCETAQRDEPKQDSPEVAVADEELAAAIEKEDAPDLEKVAPVVELVEKKVARFKPKAATLENQVRRFGLSVSQGDEEGQWILGDGTSMVLMTEGSRKAYLDGLMVFMNGPLVSKNGRVSLHPADLETFLRPAFGEPNERDILPSRLIVIDPGHGGSENGATNSEMGLLEKELTLDVSKRLESHLLERGYETALTRYDDRVVSLEERPNISNRLQAGLFVSIHFNASVNKNAKGLETFSLTSEGFVSTGGGQKLGPDARKWPGNDFDYLNAKLALAIQRGVLERLQRADRGMKKARFRVLKTLTSPGVLVECGFVSNGDEALLVRTPVYREKLALALADAIDEYVQEHAQSPEFTEESASKNGTPLLGETE